MNRSEQLPPEERLRILTKRLKNLQMGRGAYTENNRVQAILACKNAIFVAQQDLGTLQ